LTKLTKKVRRELQRQSEFLNRKLVRPFFDKRKQRGESAKQEWFRRKWKEGEDITLAQVNAERKANRRKRRK